MVKVPAQDLSEMGQPISLATAAARGWKRMAGMLAPRSPYRIGDAVVGDDPFNGRREGVVVSRQGTTTGVDTVQGVFFYDHRQLKRLD